MPQLVRQGLRGLDFATSFNESQYGVGLPYSDAEGADIVAVRLRGWLVEFGPRVGIATAPEQGSDVANLLIVTAMDSDHLRPKEPPAPQFPNDRAKWIKDRGIIIA